MALDPTIDTRELAKILSQISRHSHSLSDNIKNVSDIIADFKSPLNKYEDHLDKIRALGGDEVKHRVDLLKDLKRVQTSSKKELDSRRRQIAQLEEDIRLTTNAKRRATRAANELMSKYGQFAEITEGPKEKVQELTATLKDLKQKLKGATAEHDSHAHKLGRLNRIVELRERELAGISFKDAGQKLISKVGSAVADGLSKVFSTKSLVDIGKDLYSTTMREISTGSNVASVFRPADEFKLNMLGASRAEAVESFKENRAAVLAMNGIQGSMEVIESVEKTVKGAIPDITDQFKYAMKQSTMFVNAGIKPSQKNAALLAASFKKLQVTAGMTGDDFQNMMTDITESSGVQFQLRTAHNQKEREAILQGIAARAAEYRQLGMSTAQIKAMTKASADQANQPIKSRYIQAARTQALMGALGISGGERMAYLMRRGGQRTKSENAEYDKRAIEINKAVTASKGGSDGWQFVVDQLTEVLDPQKALTDVNGPYNTSLNEAAKVTDQAAESMGKVNSALADLLETLSRAKKVYDSHPLVQGTASTLGSIFSGLGSVAGMAAWWKMRGAAGAAAGMGTSSVPGSRPSWTGTPPGGSQPPRQTAGQRAMGVIKNNKGRIAGGAAGLVAGYAGGYAADSLREHGHSTSGNIVDVLSSAAAGAGMGAVGGLPGAIAGAIIAGGIKAYDIYGSKDSLQGSGGGGAQVAEMVEQNTETAATLSKQLECMNTGNAYLKTIADTAPKLVELSEKQLVAMMLSDKQRDDNYTRMQLLQNNRFVPRYGYVR